MEKIELDGWLLEIDREKTRDAYRQDLGGGCPCAYCQNYREAVKFLPSELVYLLDRFGLSPAKPIDSMRYFENDDGTHFYAVIFNIIGDIRTRPDSSGVHTEDRATKYTDEFQVAFKTDVEFPRYFPENVFQLEIYIHLPWVLE